MENLSSQSQTLAALVGAGGFRFGVDTFAFERIQKTLLSEFEAKARELGQAAGSRGVADFNHNSVPKVKKLLESHGIDTSKGTGLAVYGPYVDSVPDIRLLSEVRSLEASKRFLAPKSGTPWSGSFVKEGDLTLWGYDPTGGRALNVHRSDLWRVPGAVREALVPPHGGRFQLFKADNLVFHILAKHSGDAALSEASLRPEPLFGTERIDGLTGTSMLRNVFMYMEDAEIPASYAPVVDAFQLNYPRAWEWFTGYASKIPRDAQGVRTDYGRFIYCVCDGVGRSPARSLLRGCALDCVLGYAHSISVNYRMLVVAIGADWVCFGPGLVDQSKILQPTFPVRFVWLSGFENFGMVIKRLEG